MAIPDKSSSQNLTLFDRYQLSPYFSSQGLAKPEFLIHFLLAQEKPLENIVKFMEVKGSQLCQQWINSKYSEHGLTALHIAVFKENKAAVKELLVRGADPTIEDAHGFTPWKHTALLTDYKAIEELVRTEQENDKGWKQLRARAGLEPFAPSLERLFIEDSKGLRKVDQATLKEDLEIDLYIDDMYFKPSYHFLLWQLPLKRTLSPEEALFQKPNPKLPELCIKPSRFLSQNGITIRGLHAVSQIKRGELMGSYGGLIEKAQDFTFETHFTKHDPKDDYAIDLSGWKIDAYKEGNAFRFSNDGWPNAFLVPTEESCPNFYALEQIEAGEEILWDYGSGMNGLKWGKYTLTKTDQMEAYFRENSPLEMVAKLGRLQSKNTQGKTTSEKLAHILDMESLKIRLKFLFTTPLATIYLCLKQVIHASDLLTIFKEQNDLMSAFRIEKDIRDFHPRMLVSTLYLLAELQKEYLKASPLKKQIMTKVFEAFVRRFVNHVEVYQVLFGLSVINDLVKRDNFVQVYNAPAISLTVIDESMEHIFKKIEQNQWNETTSFNYSIKFKEILTYFKGQKIVVLK